MSSPDISRYLFQPEKRYVGARMQQGRVITDEDLNADRQLDAEDARRTVAEIICSKGTPNDGFRISGLEIVDEATGDFDFSIADGSFYLGGLRFELGEGERLLAQSDHLQIDAEPANAPARPVDEGFQLVYLRAWEQCVTAVEDREIVEPALGGPDTSVMVRRMRRVEVLQLPEDFQGGCAEAFAQLIASLTEDADGATIATVDPQTWELRPQIRLKVGLENEPTDDPCQPRATQGYIGAENQAIRVQLTAPDRFVWGYDNASPLYRVQARQVEGAFREIAFLTQPRDQLSQPTTDHVVEILRWGAFLPNAEKVAEQRLLSHFSRVESPFDPETGRLVVADAIPAEWVAWLDDHSQFHSPRDEDDEARYFYLRVWTGQPPEGGQVDRPFLPGGAPVPLPGTGLNVAFSHRGRAGDYWIIGARPNTPQELVPWNLLTSAPPAGPREYFASLALIEWTRALDQTLSPAIRDCRHKFRPLCASTGCCTFTVGDGVNSHGVFNSIQQAIEHLPEEGGEICLLPGLHAGNVTIDGLRDITIHGCGKHTTLIPNPNARNLPVISIRDSTCIAVEDCTVVSLDGIAFRLAQSAEGELNEIRIARNRILAFEYGIQVSGGRSIEIHANRIRVLDREGGGEAILILAEESRIERNDIGVKPAPREEQTEEPDTPEQPDPEDPCADHELLYGNRIALVAKINPLFAYFVPGFLTLVPAVAPYRALGGIRVAAGSEGIRILRNTITGGAGNGITLGGPPPEIAEEEAEEENDFRIRHSANSLYARLTGDGANRAGVSVRFTETSGLARIATGVSDSSGTILRMAEPAEYRVAAISPEYRVTGITTRDQGEFGVLHEIAVMRLRTPPGRPALGFLYDIGIERNEITAMGLSGIGNPLDGSGLAGFLPRTNAIGAFGARTASAPAGNPVLGARIVENIIRGCLLNPFDDELRQLSQSRGFGGISLGLASAISILENTFQGNGRNHLDPVCGIFVGAGDQLEIHRNQVIDNGAVDTTSSLNPREGIRGGIVAGTSLRLYPAATRLGFFRDYAARIHDNLVRQPVGHALLVAGVGPMSIDANRLHTTRSAPGTLGALAGSVLVVNRGDGRRLASGSTSFHGNQVLGGAEVRSLINLVLLTADDLGFDADQVAAEFRGVTLPFRTLSLSLLMNALLVGTTLRASDSRFQEPVSRIDRESGIVDYLISLLSLTTTMNNTVSNQGDHCIFARSALGAARVRNELNQILDSRLCQTTSVAIAMPAQNFAVARYSSNALVSSENAFSTNASASAGDAEAQLITNRTAEALATLRRADLGVANGLLQTEAEVRALVQYEAIRLATRPVEKEPRLGVFRSHLDTRLEAVGALAIDAEVAAVTVSPIDEAGMRIHGRVSDAAERGIGGILVCVIDGEGNAIEGIGARTTDVTGYYAFALRGETVKSLLESHPNGVHVSFFSPRGTPIFTTRKPTPPEAGKTEVINLRLNRDTFEALDPCKPGPAPKPNLVIVPDVVGRNQEEAQATLKEAGLSIGAITFERDPNREPGTVLRHVPEAGAEVAPGTVIDLAIAEGETPTPGDVEVPDLTHLTAEEARRRLVEGGLALGEVSTRPAGPDAAGRVIEQNPNAGAKVAPSSLVNLVVGAQSKVKVPDLTGKTLREARTILREVHLSIGQVEPPEASLQSRVVQQSPAAGEEVALETTVDLVTEEPVPQVTVPNVVRLKLSDARQTIIKAKLTIGKVQPPNASDDSIVTDQSPGARLKAEEGSPVDVAVQDPPARVAVPALVRRTLSEAKNAIKAASLKLGKVNPEDSPSQSVVVRQAPGAGKEVAEGTSVDLELRSPPNEQPKREKKPPKRPPPKKPKRKAAGSKSAKTGSGSSS